jgi:hypothetical protein
VEQGRPQPGLGLELEEAAGALVEQLAGGDRLRGAAHGVGGLEHVDQKAGHVLGPRLLGPGEARLPGGGREAGQERRDDQHRGPDPHPVTADELAGAVAPDVLAGRDRPSFEMAPQVLGELFHRGVAAFGLLAQGRIRSPTPSSRRSQ